MRRPSWLRLALFLLASLTWAAEVLPPAPARFFNDYAAVVSPATAERINRQLSEFERTNSTQVVVGVFPKMQSDSSIEDYVHRMFVDWKIGQKGKNNGVLLAVFTQDHRLRIEVGYGLEGALPDALANRIIDNEIKPQLRQNNYTAALAAGVNAIIAATKGEYKANSVGSKGSGTRSILNQYFPFYLFAAVLVFSLLRNLIRRRDQRGMVYDRNGRRYYDSHSSGGWWVGSGGGGWTGGGGDSGGFSGGGGDSGGGGASGSW